MAKQYGDIDIYVTQNSISVIGTQFVRIFSFKIFCHSYRI